MYLRAVVKIKLLGLLLSYSDKTVFFLLFHQFESLVIAVPHLFTVHSTSPVYSAQCLKERNLLINITLP